MPLIESVYAGEDVCTEDEHTTTEEDVITILGDYGINTELQNSKELIKTISKFIDSQQGYIQWMYNNDRIYVPAMHTRKTLNPGMYEIHSSQTDGIIFENVKLRTENLLRFPDTNIDSVINEIEKFWDREGIYKSFGLTYKRGILLYGPPGSGKSCTIQLIGADVVKRGGVVIKFTMPHIVTEGLRIFRTIQPNTPVVVLMEDLDSTMEEYNDSDILNMLDGVDTIDKVVFVATTNYPKELERRITNRPSRFDKRYEIGSPNAESREMYFKFLINQNKGGVKKSGVNIDLQRWVDDTDNMSIAHLKELFIATVIIGSDYDEIIEELVKMNEEDIEIDEPVKGVGFGSLKKLSRKPVPAHDRP